MAMKYGTKSGIIAGVVAGKTAGKRLLFAFIVGALLLGTVCLFSHHRVLAASDALLCESVQGETKPSAEGKSDGTAVAESAENTESAGSAESAANAESAENTESAGSAESARSADISYRSVFVKSQDTLWSIADAYYTKECGSLKDYIEQIKRCNNLSSDCINAGSRLIVPIYGG